MARIKSFIVFENHKKFNNFRDFYSTNRNEIYLNIVTIFEEFTKTRKRTLSMTIKSNLNGLNWDTEMTFKKEDPSVLLGINEFFEKEEKYEICQKIIEIFDKLKTKKINGINK